MTLTRFENITLAISGVTALGIGAYILTDPRGFYASYGITLNDNASLLSELRAPAAGLAGFGAIMLAGLVRNTFRQVSIVAALTVFLAFPAGRIVGLLIDGMPSGSVLGALAIELAIATLCLVAFRRRVLGGASGDRNRHLTVA